MFFKKHRFIIIVSDENWKMTQYFNQYHKQLLVVWTEYLLFQIAIHHYYPCSCSYLCCLNRLIMLSLNIISHFFILHLPTHYYYFNHPHFFHQIIYLKHPLHLFINLYLKFPRLLTILFNYDYSPSINYISQMIIKILKILVFNQMFMILCFVLFFAKYLIIACFYFRFRTFIFC